jgi:hypothetical protein
VKWSDFGSVLKNRAARNAFILWLIANLGGLIVSTFAFVTVWFFHRTGFELLPNINVFLATAAIALAVSGVSYIRLTLDNRAYMLSPALVFSWPFLLLVVYGIFVVIGVKAPVVGNQVVWAVTLAVFIVIMVWSSIMYLNEQGLRLETDAAPRQPAISADFHDVVADLPKVPTADRPQGEE